MTRSIKDFNEEIAAKGYELHAEFTYRKHWDGIFRMKVTHYYMHKDHIGLLYPFLAVRHFNAPKKIEHWLADISKSYWCSDMTNDDIEKFFETWKKKMRACGLDPEAIVQIDGGETIC